MPWRFGMTSFMEHIEFAFMPFEIVHCIGNVFSASLCFHQAQKTIGQRVWKGIVCGHFQSLSLVIGFGHLCRNMTSSKTTGIGIFVINPDS